LNAFQQNKIIYVGYYMTNLALALK
jgi:hypothetical protein